MITTPSTIEELLDYWPGNIPFKGALVSEDGSCMCAQGQALHFLQGLTPDELRTIDQAAADKQVAALFGISLAHSVLLRIVNDGQPGAPSVVIRNPEQVLGGQAHAILAFWRHLDQMNPAAWAATWTAAQASARARKTARKAAGASARARTAARKAAGAAAEALARTAADASARAGTAADALAWAAVRALAEASAGATNEIQGAAVMRASNQPFFFLPLFGFSNPEAVIAAELEGQAGG